MVVLVAFCEYSTCEDPLGAFGGCIWGLDSGRDGLGVAISGDMPADVEKVSYCLTGFVLGLLSRLVDFENGRRGWRCMDYGRWLVKGVVSVNWI